MVMADFMEIEEGLLCPYCECGTIEINTPDECTCFVNPPCDSCIDRGLKCNYCGEDDFRDYEATR